MTDREHKTRRKLTFRIPVPKPRNPLVAPALRRVAGPHRKPTGATRTAARVALRRETEKTDVD